MMGRGLPRRKRRLKAKLDTASHRPADPFRLLRPFDFWGACLCQTQLEVRSSAYRIEVSHAARSGPVRCVSRLKCAPADQAAKEVLVAQTISNWNSIVSWLRQMDLLRKACALEAA